MFKYYTKTYKTVVENIDEKQANDFELHRWWIQSLKASVFQPVFCLSVIFIGLMFRGWSSDYENMALTGVWFFFSLIINESKKSR